MKFLKINKLQTTFYRKSMTLRFLEDIGFMHTKK